MHHALVFYWMIHKMGVARVSHEWPHHRQPMQRVKHGIRTEYVRTHMQRTCTDGALSPLGVRRIKWATADTRKTGTFSFNKRPTGER